MDKLKKMTIFVRVVEAGSFAAAAKTLDVSPAIVGRHISDLEALLGQRLVNRTTRSMEITTVGWRYFEGCKDTLAQVEAVEQSVRDPQEADLHGLIRLSAPEGLGSPFLLDVIDGFQREHPQVAFDLLLDNQAADFVSSGVDVAIRFATSLEDSSLIVQKLGETPLRWFAAPQYLAERGTPKNLEALDQHACLAFATARYGHSWPIITDKGIKKIKLPWRLILNNTQTYREALVRGMGIGVLPELLAAPLLESGELQAVALHAILPDIGIYALYPSREFQALRVRQFLAHIKTHF